MISGRVMSEPPMPSEPQESSSVATTMPTYSDSPPVEKPPNSSGIERPNPPSSPSPEMIDSGMSPLVRWTSSACGRTCSSAKRWNIDATISKSLAEVARSGRFGEGREKRRIAVGGDETVKRCEPVVAQPPERTLARPPGSRDHSARARETRPRVEPRRRRASRSRGTSERLRVRSPSGRGRRRGPRWRRCRRARPGRHSARWITARPRLMSEAA